MLHRLMTNWVYGGFLAGLLLLLLAPIFVHGWPITLRAAYFCLPAYMLHQYEEHDKDRFRAFVNRLLGDGHEVLSVPAVFVINVPGVWGVMALSLWLSARVHPGLALIAVYLPLLNAVIHIAQAIAARGYNPGLVSAIAVFVPLCGWSLQAIQQTGFGTLAMHLAGIGTSLIIHVVIAVSVLHNRRKFV